MSILKSLFLTLSVFSLVGCAADGAEPTTVLRASSNLDNCEYKELICTSSRPMKCKEFCIEAPEVDECEAARRPPEHCNERCIEGESAGREVVVCPAEDCTVDPEDNIVCNTDLDGADGADGGDAPPPSSDDDDTVPPRDRSDHGSGEPRRGTDNTPPPVDEPVAEGSGGDDSAPPPSNPDYEGRPDDGDNTPPPIDEPVAEGSGGDDSAPPPSNR